MDVITVKDLYFKWKGQSANLLEGSQLNVKGGQRLFIKGLSGSGKSSLLNLLAGIHTPQRGSIELLGTNICKLKATERDEFRANHIGYIFQMFNLVPYLSVIENVTLACRFSKERKKKLSKNGIDVREEALRLLKEVGLTGDEIINKTVTELSVGQQQRVAACRALIGSPEILIADEPTSSLDEDAQQSFINLLLNECEQNNITLVFVSHDTRFTSLFDQCLELKNGRLHALAEKMEGDLA